MTWIIKWLISTVAVLLAAYLLPGVVVENILAAFAAAVVVGFINSFMRPILLFVTLPFNIATLGLFTLVLNALLILLADKIVPGFSVDGFWWALLFSIVLWVVNSLLKVRDDKAEVRKSERIRVKSEVVEE